MVQGNEEGWRVGEIRRGLTMFHAFHVNTRWMLAVDTRCGDWRDRTVAVSTESGEMFASSLDAPRA